MGYMTLYDILEKLMRQRVINKQLISLIESRYRDILEDIIRLGIDKGILEEIDGELKLIKPVELLIVLPLFNVIPDRFSLYIRWHEFEEYISRILIELGWDVYRGYTHTRIERFQIDIIALNNVMKLAIFIECKHWKQISRIHTNINNIIEDHLIRVEKYMRNCEWVCSRIGKLRNIKEILPVIIVLYDLPVKVFRGVPVVSVYKIFDFIINIDRYIDLLNLTLYRNRCYHGS